MKFEIELTAYHSNIIRKLSDYSEIGAHRLVQGIIINAIEELDTDLWENLERNLPESYYDDYTGRYKD